MNIKKDKSLDFSIIFAVDSSLLEGQNEILSEEDRKKAEKEGFSITDYDDGKMKGYTLSKKIKNIDSVSSTNDSEYNLSGIFEETEQKYMFKVKKGLFKNTYYAKFKFDAANSGLDDMMNSSDNNSDNDFNWDDDNDVEGLSDWDFSDDEYENSDEKNDNSEMDFSQLQGLASNMDLSFNITLPYSAKKNNASSANDNNKNLTWNLMTIGNTASTIEFEFELYNKDAIFIGVGITGGLLIIVVVAIIFAVKSKNNKNGRKNPSIENQVVHNNSTVQQSGVQQVNSQTPVQQPSNDQIKNDNNI